MSYAATMTQKGQITIPVAIRNVFGLVPSSRLIFSIEEKKIIAQPYNSDILSLYGSLKSKNKKPADLKKIRSIMRQKIAADIASEGLI
ncbi:AbrB/MazE/SpoVT family DNA-binding domain-containing protein [Candidatus Roizmanbacteria bacterium]|nr:AbrB/MazE/SpoVT family DNA-binding domain-containing protein [Candidatus Roizmanbacteria bacterium]